MVMTCAGGASGFGPASGGGVTMLVHVVTLASSGQGSHASPSLSPSVSGCLPPSILRGGLKTFGQLSVSSGMPSPSLSCAVMVPSNSLGRMGMQVGSSAGSSQKKSG